MRKSARRSAILLAVMGIVGAKAARGQTFVTWDASGDSPNSPVDGSNTWSTRVADWASAGADVDWKNGYVAYIGNGGTPGTITVNDGAGNVSALGLYFTQAYTIAAAAANTMSMTGTHSTPEPVISVATGITVTITAPIGGGEGIVINPTTSSTLDGVTLPAGGGAGTLIYANNNTYQGGTDIEAGTLQIGNGGSTGTLGSVNLTDNALVAFDRSDAIYTFTGHIGGSGAIEQIGFGSTTLTNANNNFTGGTTILAGTLVAANASGSATGQGSVNVNGGTLASGAVGAVSGNVIAGSTANEISPGGLASIGTLSVGGLTTTNATTLQFDLGSGSGMVTNGDLLSVNGALTLAQGTALEFGGNPVSGDDYRLMKASFGEQPLSNFVLPATPSGDTFSLSTVVDPGYLDLVVQGPPSLAWTNAQGNNLWDSTSSNWNNGSGSTVYANGDAVLFSDSNGGPANYVVTLNMQVSPESVTINNSAGNYVFTGTGSITGTAFLAKSGSGVLTINTSGSSFSAVTVTGGAVQLGTSTGLTTMTSLSISGGGTFDVNNNHVIIDYGGGKDPIASIAALLKSGYAGGAWNGANGIVSSAAAANAGSYGLGYADSADPGNPAGLSSGTIEITYALLGDANLSGVVDGTDFGIVAANFNKGVNGWDQGDFNYDGVVDGSDFGDLAANFNRGANGASLGEPASDDPAILSFAAANGLLVDVPEPASLGFLAFAIAGLIRHSCRRRRD